MLTPAPRWASRICRTSRLEQRVRRASWAKAASVGAKTVMPEAHRDAISSNSPQKARASISPLSLASEATRRKSAEQRAAAAER